MIKKNTIITTISLFVIILIIGQTVIATSADIAPSADRAPQVDKAPEADIAPHTESSVDAAPQADIAPSADIAPEIQSSVDAAPEADIAPNDDTASESEPTADIAPQVDKAPEADIAPEIQSSVDAAPQADIAPNDDSFSSDQQDECILCQLMKEQDERDIKPNDDLSEINYQSFIDKLIEFTDEDIVMLDKIFSEYQISEMIPVEVLDGIRDYSANIENDPLVAQAIQGDITALEEIIQLEVVSEENQLETLVSASTQEQIGVAGPCDVYVSDLLEMFFEAFVSRIRNIANDLRVWTSMTIEEKRDWFDNNFGYLFITYGPTIRQAIYGALLIFIDNLHDFIQSLKDNLFDRLFNIWGWIIVIRDFIQNEKQETYDYLYELICGNNPCPPEDSELIIGGSETIGMTQVATGYGSLIL